MSGRHKAVPRSLTLAALQHRCGIDPAANGEAIRALARAAAAQGAQLIHICEGGLSGYIGPNKAHFRGWNVDWAAVRSELEATAALAAELGVWIVAGCHHRLTAPNLPHNSVFVFSDQGQVVGRYDKRFLSHSELSGFYTPGTEPLVVEVAGFRVAVAVCIEIQFPQLWQDYADQGADLVLFSSFHDDPMFEIQLRAHAATYGLWVSVAVPAQNAHVTPAGLIGPHGYWLAEAPRGDDEAFVIATVNPDDPVLEGAALFAKPWRQTAREGGIYRRLHTTDPRSLDRHSL